MTPSCFLLVNSHNLAQSSPLMDWKNMSLTKLLTRTAVAAAGNSSFAGSATHLITTNGSRLPTSKTVKPSTYGMRSEVMGPTAGSFPVRFCHNFSLIGFDAPVLVLVD